MGRSLMPLAVSINEMKLIMAWTGEHGGLGGMKNVRKGIVVDILQLCHFSRRPEIQADASIRTNPSTNLFDLGRLSLEGVVMV